MSNVASRLRTATLCIRDLNVPVRKREIVVHEIATTLALKNYGDIKSVTVLKCFAAIRHESTNREGIRAHRQLRDKPADMDALLTVPRRRSSKPSIS